MKESTALGELELDREAPKLGRKERKENAVLKSKGTVLGRKAWTKV